VGVGRRGHLPRDGIEKDRRWSNVEEWLQGGARRILPQFIGLFNLGGLHVGQTLGRIDRGGAWRQWRGSDVCSVSEEVERGGRGKFPSFLGLFDRDRLRGSV